MAKNKAKMNKFVTSAITATMVASAVAPVAALAADESTSKFTDISGYAQDTQDKINALVEAGIVNGTSDTTFSPSTAIKRSQVVKLLGRYLVESGIAEVPANWDTKERFKDVPVDFQDADLVKNAAVVYDAGVFQGNNGVLNGAGEISRQNMALVLDRAAEAITGKSFVELAEGESSNVTDLKDAKAEARDAIEALNALEISTVQEFKPAYNVSRANFATFLFNAIEVIANVEEEVVDAKVDSVTATNGKLTVQMNTKLETTPISSEFKVVQNINGTTKAVAASSVAYDETTKTVSLTVPELSATEVDQNVSYTVAYKETPAVSSNSFTIAKVGELKATSATQVSSTQIKVQFNQKVTRASAETLANYKIGNADANGEIDGSYESFADTATGTGTTVALQEDEQSVIITLGTAEVANGILGAAGQFDNNTSFLLEVSNNVLPQAGKAAEKNVELPFSLKDAGKPTVEKFAVNEAGDLVVSFNEKLNNTVAKVVINGQSLTKAPVYSAVTGKSTVTFSKAELTGAKPAGFALELGKTYSVSVADAEDAYGTAMNIYTSQFTYTAAADAPQVTKVESKNEKSVTVTFSEPVLDVTTSNALLAANFNITKGAKHFSPATVTSNAAGTVYTLAFNDLQDDFIFDSYKNETSVALDIHVSDIKDNVGNITPASKHTVTVLKDTVKPEVVKKENKAAGVVDLTFNKAFDAAVTNASVAGKAYVLTSTGVKLPLAAADVAVTLTPQGKLAFNLATVGTTTLDAGNYTLVLEQGALVDTALNGGNKNNEIRVPFIIAADGLEDKPVVNSVDATITAGDIVVTFAEQVSYESAAKAANYTLDGKEIPAASEFALDSTGKILTITLPEATYKESGDKVLKINGVRNLAGTVMDQYEAVQTVNENEKIELKFAKVVNGDIILTFNENVDATTLANGTLLADTDFNIKVNGVGVTIASADVEEHDAVADATVVAKNQVRISAPTGVSFATGTITVEVKEDAAAKDAAGNGAKAVTVTATR